MNGTRKSKRKCETNSQYATVPTRNKVVKAQVSTEPRRNSSISTNEFNPDKLLELCVLRIPTSTWYRILPNSTLECEDLSFAIRQSWDTISPLLIKLGYIKNYGKECRINQIKFENLQHVIPGIDQCHTPFITLKVDLDNYLSVLESHNIVDQLNRLTRQKIKNLHINDI